MSQFVFAIMLSPFNHYFAGLAIFFLLLKTFLPREDRLGVEIHSVTLIV